VILDEVTLLLKHFSWYRFPNVEPRQFYSWYIYPEEGEDYGKCVSAAEYIDDVDDVCIHSQF
jgi:hypothetical protein